MSCKRSGSIYVADTATQAVSTAQQLNQLRADDRERLGGLGRIAATASQLLDAFFETPIANINALTKKTGLTPATVGKALTKMEQELGIVKELTGQKRNRVFAYTGYLNILNHEE